MRDNQDGYPELLDAYEREGSYFGAVRVIVAGEVAAFEFGLDERGYLSLKRVLQSRPFEPRGQYRYFFRGNFSKREAASDTVTFNVRETSDAGPSKSKLLPFAPSSIRIYYGSSR